MSDTNAYTVQQLTADRLTGLATLYIAVYGYAQPPGYFEKKYDTAYTGASFIGFIAYHEGQPVGYYGVIPCFIEYRGTVVLAAQSADTMTHPQHRKKGLFVWLAKQTFELCRTAGIQLVYGLPNQNSHMGLVKLGWTFNPDLHRFHIPVSALPFERLSAKLALTNLWYEQYEQRILDKYAVAEPGLPNIVMSEGFAGVYRNEAYLQYKRFTGSRVIQVGKGRAWIKIKNGLIIGDLHVEPNDFDDTMKILLRIAKRLGVPVISFQLSQGTRLYELFANKYTPVASFPTGLFNISSSIPMEQLRFTYADIDIF